MKSNILILVFTLMTLGVMAQNGYVTWSNSFLFKRSEWYVPMTPSNNDGNRKSVGWIKDSTMFFLDLDTIKFSILSGIGDRIVMSRPNGSLFPINVTYRIRTDINTGSTVTFVRGQEVKL